MRGSDCHSECDMRKIQMYESNMWEHVTCSNSMSPSWLMVKLCPDPDCRLLLRRRKSCSRKWECILISWSRHGNSACTTPGLSWSSSSMPWRNTFSIICSVCKWRTSVWISSIKTPEKHIWHSACCYCNAIYVFSMLTSSCLHTSKSLIWLVSAGRRSFGLVLTENMTLDQPINTPQHVI